MRFLVMGAVLWGVSFVEAAEVKTERVVTVLQGQSNAGLFSAYGFSSVYAPMVAALTGVPTEAEAALNNVPEEKGYSIAPGHPTYAARPGKDEAAYWLAPWGSLSAGPSAWPLGTNGRALKIFLNKLAPKVASDRVVTVFLRYHSESDSLFRGDAVKIYPAANARLLALATEWLGKAPGQVGFFLGAPCFELGVNPEARAIIRETWAKTIGDPSNNTHWMFGTVSDSDTKDRAHAVPQDFRMVGRRTAVAVSRWLFETGRTKNDLSWLPNLGPRIVAVHRVKGRADLLDVIVAHDKGSTLLLPENLNLSVFSIIDAGRPLAVKSVSLVNPTTLRLRFPRGLSGPSSKILFDYDSQNAFQGTNRLITDDWHTEAIPKPDLARTVPELAELRLPLQRLEKPLIVENAATPQAR